MRASSKGQTRARQSLVATIYFRPSRAQTALIRPSSPVVGLETHVGSSVTARRELGLDSLQCARNATRYLQPPPRTSSTCFPRAYNAISARSFSHRSAACDAPRGPWVPLATCGASCSRHMATRVTCQLNFRAFGASASQAEVRMKAADALLAERCTAVEQTQQHRQALAQEFKPSSPFAPKPLHDVIAEHLLVADLQQLYALLEAYNMQSLDSHARLRLVYAATAGQALAPLAACFDALDFSQAVVQCTTLIRQPSSRP